MFDLITIIRSGKEILGALIEGAAKFPVIRDRQRSAEICRALRLIYFTPQGMISIMEKIGSGEAVIEDEFNAALHNFADAQAQVNRSLSILERDALFHDLRITIDHLNVIEMARHRKINLRQSILENFSKYRRQFSTEQQRLARQISGELESLNRQLEELDRKFNILAINR